MEKDVAIFNHTLKIIKDLYGEMAEFRDGQYEAIEATLLGKRTLVVQKTGWGKSLVYFASTKILREQHKGVTIVISPLLVLMENQIEAAKKLGLKCDVLNSTVGDRRSEIIQSLINDELDLILVTPETLFKDDLQAVLKSIKIGLFVIDEAHCISDWGHDFRLEYGNLHKILKTIPSNVPILATTATANNRVVDDLRNQMGNDVYISRGPLIRNNLAIQVLNLPDKASRYAWILENINKFPGSGIIYCLTQRDCDHLTEFLSKNGINVRSYYSRKDDDKNTEAEMLFKNNQIKAIIATIKLGMGYDKGDIGFVVHFQQPANVVSYYQQIGRAGRNIKHSYAFLMTGKEDEEILDYFINTAFPSEEEMNKIIDLLKENNGLSKLQLYPHINKRTIVVDKALLFLENEGFIFKDGTKYYLTTKTFIYNREYYESIMKIRRQEKEQMKSFTRTGICFSKYVVNCLDDFTAKECGICANCKCENIIELEDNLINLEKAQQYINNLIMPIEPRKQWPDKKKIYMQNREGICLSKYGDIGYGELVKRDKYSANGKFCDELVGKSASILKDIVKNNDIVAVVAVPSLRSSIVDDFAQKLARSLNLKFEKLLYKTDAKQQKFMDNSYFQCQNASSSFHIFENYDIPKKVILVDDIVDSKWTLTVCGHKLMENGCEFVFPFALADSSTKEDK